MKKTISKKLFKHLMKGALIFMLLVKCGLVYAHGGACTAELKVYKGLGEGTVYASTSKDATSGGTSASANCGDSGSGPHTHTLYGFATPAEGYTLAGWNTSENSLDDLIKSNPLPVTITSEDHSTVTMTYYAHFVEKKSAKVTFLRDLNGSYDYTISGSTKNVSSSNQVEDDVLEFTLSNPVPNDGYVFAGFYQINNDETIVNLEGSAPLVSFTESGEVSIGVRFVASNLPKFGISETNSEYYGLQAAISAAKSGQTIFPKENCTIDGADLISNDNNTYTIPYGVTLLVPYEANNAVNTTPSTVTSGTPSRSVYRTLTLSSGTTINVVGSICVNAKMCLTMGYNGSAMNGYGLIDMKEGSAINLKKGANCYVWGFIIGDGIITAESGSNIHETFQFKHRGGNALTSIASTNANKKVFPINQYYIQSIEVPIMIKKGASEKVYTGVHNSSAPVSIDFIGESGLFNITESDAYLVKKYDVSTDRQEYTLYGDATIGSIKFGMSGFSKESKDFVLPITNNMTLNIESGTTTIQYETAILPDVEINVASGANVVSSDNIYVYDSLNWKGAYAYANDYSSPEVAQIAPVVYRHGGLQFDRKSRKVRDAMINVQGNFIGKIYTTEGGANIKSSAGGSITIPKEITPTTTYQAGQDNTTGKFDAYTVVPAQLRNADGSYLATSGLAANTTITYANGHWGWKEIWNDDKNKFVNAINTPQQVNNASVQSWAGIEIPEGSIGTWETTINEAKQEVIHTAVVKEIADAISDGLEALEVLEDQTITIDPDKIATEDKTVEVETTNVRVNATLEVKEGATYETEEFVLESDMALTLDDPEEAPSDNSASGQVVGEVKATKAYFDLTLNNPTSRRWNAFTVPFEVNLKESTGARALINGEPLELGRGYDILFYDGAERAAHGKTADCWKYVEDPVSIGGGDSILHPGKAYMIASASRAIQKVRFTKAGNAPIAFSGEISVTGGEGDNGGWNGIGNPTTYHAILDAGVTVCQVHDGGPIGSDGYVPMPIDKFVVGKAVYIQAENSNNVSIARATIETVSAPQSAPRRTREEIKTSRYDVQIAAAGKKMADRVYLLTEEDKEDRYIVLSDLSKAGVSKVRAQMWVDKYEEMLCKHTAPLIEGKAYYPLGISVPRDGEYEIYVAQQPDGDASLYLTLDNEIIWNLSESACTITLSAGTTSNYGLRIVSKAPQVATGVDEAIVDAKGETQKMLINGNVYIIRENHVYSVDGIKVK